MGASWRRPPSTSPSSSGTRPRANASGRWRAIAA
ncbi:hypothetical protein CCHR01_15803 [Colletotrichum chrysophilum]|uniref:Uncharacterized protein n=1 Tax=Colletotrichum chrysophilum TaxID=1836956 RepID=A0AAD9A5J6_9PEZI|nr:hypothetical protein CCHR01_15803 [Colletotrichum chrysophilum]